jgi:hypothetical protein
LICQYFLKDVLDGASLGRSTLQARQRFIQNESPLDPVDLKTLAQFNLMGDPSIHPVEATPVARQARAMVSKAFGARSAVTLLSAATDPLAGQSERRARLSLVGQALQESTPVAEPSASAKPAGKVASALRDIAKQAGVPAAALQSYRIRGPHASTLRKSLGAKEIASENLHVLVTSVRTPDSAPFDCLVALIAKEKADTIVSYKTLCSR